MSDKIKELLEKIKSLSETEYYQIKIKNKKPELSDSKIGGLPYWTKEKEFPKDKEGNNLFLLAQINFEKEKTSAPLPTKGLLQFFIGDDDLIGLDLDDQVTQNNFRVIYHENIDYALTEDYVEKLGIKSSLKAQNHPVKGEFKLSLTKKKGYVTINDIKFKKIFAQAYKEIYGKEVKEKEEYYNVLKNGDTEKFEDKLRSFENTPYHKMLGYAYFTQEDPRYKKQYENYDTLLFQLDSECNKKGDYVIWGDLGIANFFIKKKALEEKDFRDVLYNWDCT